MSKSTALMETIEPEKLAKYVRFLVGSFRFSDAEDGEVLTRGVTAILGSYPESVVRLVCDPRCGLPSKSKSFPSLWEVSAACERTIRPLREQERLRRAEEANKADRPADISGEERVRRKAFIADWREKQQILAEKSGDLVLTDMDPRKVKSPELRAAIVAAHEAKLARLTEMSHSTPMTLSEAARAGAGLSERTDA